jgi:hypothetical protein
MLEKTIKAAVKRRLDQIGAYHHWPVQMGFGAACLDCHACYKGIYIAIETKAPGKKLTARQLVTINQIRAAGGLVLVIDSLEQTYVLLADLVASHAVSLGAATTSVRPMAKRTIDPT